MIDIPSVCPESLCDSFKAGNLKNMKIYIEPSNTLAVSPRASSRLSVSSQYFVIPVAELNIPLRNIRSVFLGAVLLPSISRIEVCPVLSPKFSTFSWHQNMSYERGGRVLPSDC